eukprot:CAMPEP_0180133588 /NCGR_PEP_ID=MMETSP0986-20121125/9627_1 /TAXON_ID=697907 /ORGANISM="non described non described, Strain CCMP2293" /LENGTH=110 /DNA_ID=CAMNT_0022073729 /DNA_START=72 /DNA_END=405 /DNA_ORIENTATION=+
MMLQQFDVGKEEGRGGAQEVSPHWTTRYTFNSLNAPNTAFSAYGMNGAFIFLAVNSFFAVLTANCMMSALSVNSIMSVASVNSAFRSDASENHSSAASARKDQTPDEDTL